MPKSPIRRLAAIGGTDGLFFGNRGQLKIQLISVGAAWIYSFAVTEEDEVQGFDLSLHGERAYTG